MQFFPVVEIPLKHSSLCNIAFYLPMNVVWLHSMGSSKVSFLMELFLLWIVKWQKSQEGQGPSHVGLATIHLWKYSEESGKSMQFKNVFNLKLNNMLI